MPVMIASGLHAWWADLRHQGLVVAPALLEEYFSAGLTVPKPFSYQRLRDRYAAFETWHSSDRAYEPGKRGPLYDWLDGVLEVFLGHKQSRWQKGNNIASSWKHQTFNGEQLSPHRVLFRDATQREPALFVWIEPTRELARGNGRTAYGKLLGLLRAKSVRLGLLTNGKQFRLCYAGVDYDSWVEWDVEVWFAEEELRRQLYGFYTLLGPSGMDTGSASSTSTGFPLLEAAEASRTRQGDLSIVMGEQMRQAVELVLNEANQAVRTNPDLLELVRTAPPGKRLSERRMLEALYQAAVRIIMRMVIILFAEARDLLPRSLSTYSISYSLEGLYEQLRRAEQYEGHNALEEQHSAWKRLLALFYIVYHGSWLDLLPVKEYGGLLFRPGEFDSPDAMLRAMALFESPDVSVTDATVLRLLKLLKNGKVRIGQGHSSRWVPGPVDFSELRTEYIGLMYQGLLDYNLYLTDEPMIFLNLGQEPVLPLRRLEDMPDQQLRELLKKLSVEKSVGPVASEDDASDEDEEGEDSSPGGEDGEGSEAEEAAPDEEVSEAEDAEIETAQQSITFTEADLLRRRVQSWAERAVEVGRLVKKPRGKHLDLDARYEKERAESARRLIKDVLAQGDFYLVRRGGTRKGSGTFYTKPQLAVPIARHALEPLLYRERSGGARLPRTPEEILAIKVCDPACGSAAFLVAALHYITEALYQSLVYHRRLVDAEAEGTLAILRERPTLPYGIPSKAHPEEELVPARPGDEQFETMMKGRLRRYVVENCIYGVDISPLAVELARMSLWIETMDRDLPFTFLDHKIKVGNALIGGWFDSFREYPIMAWLRDGGDTSHSHGVHFQAEEWTRVLKQTRNDVIKPELVVQIESTLPQLFPEHVQQTPEELFSDITAVMEQLHALPAVAAREREERYLALQQRGDFQELKRAFDRWCAAWFWPVDDIGHVPTPATFYLPGDDTRDKVGELAEELRFFHWELEFPDVFYRHEHGFDAILANPPWEISKPSSKEFFSDYDPLYRSYGKQEALNAQRSLFVQGEAIEREWLGYQSFYKAMSNWAKHAASPFGDPEVEGMEAISLQRGKRNTQLHDTWRQRRENYAPGYTDQVFPFRYQGSADLNTYKMFLEVAHHLLREDGRLGMLVPSGVYTDSGSASLRRLFLDHCRWWWLFGFINHRRIFEIDSRFKFNVVLLEKGQRTETMRVAFNQENLSDLSQPEPLMLEFPRRQVEHFSPKSLAIIEAQTARDIIILDKLYNSTELLGDQDAQGWQIEYATEFHMTNDSRLFPPLPTWEEKGYRPDGYGRWVDAEGNAALPLYEGRMIGPFDPCEKGWVSGKGRGAVWQEIPFENKTLEPQYLISFKDAIERIGKPGNGKISFMSIGSATNTRSMYASFIDNMPCGHSIATLRVASEFLSDTLNLGAILNSFVYDYALRSRLGGLNLSSFVLAETPLIHPSRLHPTACAQLVARLNLVMPCFALQWLKLRESYPQLGEQHWRQLWAITEHERLRLRCILDALIAALYGLEYDDFAWILRDEGEESNRKNPKGFWRVDKDKPKGLRHTTLALTAFQSLKEIGLEAFCQQDWLFPPVVAAQLGPRFTEWQLQGSVEESWAECEEHARRIKETPVPLPEENRAQRNGKNGRHPQRQSKERSPAPKVQQTQLDLWNVSNRERL